MPKRTKLDNKGFTLIEMLVVITIIGILAAMALPNYMKAKDKAKEAECKSNLHIIQAALERYSVDNEGIYPPYLIGGDSSGWQRWHTLNDGGNNNAVYLHDPLVEYGYLDSYPKNPFVDDGAIVINTTNGGTSNDAGSGDPRFGMGGGKVGNVVEDPRYYRQDDPSNPLEPVIETFLTLPAGGVPSFPDIYHYEMGGIRNSNGDEFRGSWNGDFFYRAIREVKVGRTGGLDGITKYPDLGYSRSNNFYIMGTFGASYSKGQDVIRLTGRDPNGNQLRYRTAPESGMDIPLGRKGVDGNGLPEVFGGGDALNGPVWPYSYDIDKKGVYEMRYGAPDGIPDGIIMVLTSSGNEETF